MERILTAVEMVNQAAGGESLLGTIKIAVLPIAKVFTMCFLGFLMASKYVNILPANGRKLLNGVCMPVLLSQFPLLLMPAFMLRKKKNKQKINGCFYFNSISYLFVNCITV